MYDAKFHWQQFITDEDVIQTYMKIIIVKNELVLSLFIEWIYYACTNVLFSVLKATTRCSLYTKYVTRNCLPQNMYNCAGGKWRSINQSTDENWITFQSKCALKIIIVVATGANVQ